MVIAADIVLYLRAGDMETSLHRGLKLLYGREEQRLENWVDGFRIDAIVGGQLVEIQHGSLAAIRDKVHKLLAGHDVLVVKPIVVRKQLVKLDRRDGEVISRRLSPKQGRLVDLFDDLVHFTRVFPHPRLTLEAVLVEIEEWRYPGHGRRRRHRDSDFQVADQTLLGVQAAHRIQSAEDLVALLPQDLPVPFHTGDLAVRMALPRWRAQKIAYCLRHAQAVRESGKLGNARLYELTVPAARRSRRSNRGRRA